MALQLDTIIRHIIIHTKRAQDKLSRRDLLSIFLFKFSQEL